MVIENKYWHHCPSHWHTFSQFLPDLWLRWRGCSIATVSAPTLAGLAKAYANHPWSVTEPEAVGVPGWQTGAKALRLYSQSPQACKQCLPTLLLLATVCLHAFAVWPQSIPYGHIANACQCIFTESHPPHYRTEFSLLQRIMSHSQCGILLCSTNTRSQKIFTNVKGDCWFSSVVTM